MRWRIAISGAGELWVLPLLFFLCSSLSALEYPFLNHVPYAFQAIANDQVFGVGSLQFSIEKESGLISCNLFVVNQAEAKAPVHSEILFLEIVQMEQRKGGPLILLGRQQGGLPLVATVWGGARGKFTQDSDFRYIDFQLTMQGKQNASFQPLGERGMEFYRKNLPGIDLGYSPAFAAWKYQK